MLARRRIVVVATFFLVLLVAAVIGANRSSVSDRTSEPPATQDSAAPHTDDLQPDDLQAEDPQQEEPAPLEFEGLPDVNHDGAGVFHDDPLLVAYYGTPGTGALGVLGESPIGKMNRQLLSTAEPFARDGQRIQPVYELIVTVADSRPGVDGDYSRHIGDRKVEHYVRAARRSGALVLLDIQPGRAGFLSAAKHWRWALSDPAVGLALDPEWRMGPDDVPAQTIGSVSAKEVNRVAGWLAKVVRDEDLPDKLFVVHQFRSWMVRSLDQVFARPGLAMVQNIDGFGTRSQKLASYQALAQPDRFHLGMKLFYDEDTDLIDPAYLRTIRPRVHFLSFQ